MSSVWCCVPSARPVDHVRRWAEAWRDMGYKVALHIDKLTLWEQDTAIADYWRCATTYPGYAQAVNKLAADVLARDPACDWIVTGGDDVFPDRTKRADEIAAECTEHFGGTFGVCQPTGHRWGENEPWAKHQFPGREAYIDRIAGSPFLGREYCRRAHQGAGPFHPEFLHMHSDESVFEYANMLGIYWPRRDLTHLHQHWGLDGDPSKMPEFAQKWNSKSHWDESKAILDRLKGENFSSCLPLS